MEFVQGLAGVLLGGALALAGSLITSRRELTRQHRVRLLTELVPSLIEHLENGAGSDIAGDATTVERAAIVASRADRREAETTVEAARETVAALDAFDFTPYGESDPTHGQRDRYDATRQRAIEAATRYQDWLADRF